MTAVHDDARTMALLRDWILVGYAPATASGPPERRAEIVAHARAQIEGSESDAPAP